jgi:hypothetical protein
LKGNITKDDLPLWRAKELFEMVSLMSDGMMYVIVHTQRNFKMEQSVVK